MKRDAVLLVGLLLLPLALRAQSNPCENPKSPRGGVFALEAEPKQSDSETLKDIRRRTLAAERRLRDALLKQLIPAMCIVGDMEIFSDPTNYPALKGSLIIEITADVSWRDPDIAALAVNVYASEGAYVEQRLPMIVLPILLEKDSNLDDKAKSVIMGWNSVVDAMARLGRQAKQ